MMSTLTPTEDVLSLAEFKQNSAELIEQLEETGRPLVLTVDGEAKLVVQDAVAYERLLDLAERLELIEGIRESLESMRRGEGKPAREFFEELRKKHNIPPREK
jgi:prevent-host-death family protein